MSRESMEKCEKRPGKLHRGAIWKMMVMYIRRVLGVLQRTRVGWKYLASTSCAELAGNVMRLELGCDRGKRKFLGVDFISRKVAPDQSALRCGVVPSNLVWRNADLGRRHLYSEIAHCAGPEWCLCAEKVFFVNILFKHFFFLFLLRTAC